jgi:hypothetical protein
MKDQSSNDQVSYDTSIAQTKTKKSNTS